MEEIEIEQEVIEKAVHSGDGPDCFIKLEWNRSTMNCFNGRKKPMQGRRYCLYCERMNGKHAFFTLKQI